MKQPNNYICFGLLLNGIWIISSRFNLLSDFIEGLCVGLGLLFILLGMSYKKYNISQLRRYKKLLLKRVTTK